MSVMLTGDRVGSNAGGLARVVAADEVLTAPREAVVLFPRSGGNMHAFTAVTPCAILDVITPPYSEEQGRPSTYFADIPVPSLPGARSSLMIHVFRVRILLICRPIRRESIRPNQPN
jgi:hypothetical protein